MSFHIKTFFVCLLGYIGMDDPYENKLNHCGQSFNITDHRLRDSLHINCSAEIQLENSLTKPLELKCQLSSTQLKIISMNGENL